MPKDLEDIKKLHQGDADFFLQIPLFHSLTSTAGGTSNAPTITVEQKLSAQAHRFWRSSHQGIPQNNFVDQVRLHLVEQVPTILERCSTIAQLRSYVHVVIKNKCNDIVSSNEFRHRRHVQFKDSGVSESKALDIAAHQAGHHAAARPDTAAAQREEEDFLYEALASLPAKEAQAIQLYYLDGKTAEEAASIIGCSEKTVRNRANRALASLRRHLKQHGIRDL